MKKWIWIAALAVVGLLAYGVAGPFLTINAIRDAVRTENARALAKQVDFPPLRHSLKLQVREAIVRRAGADAQSSLAGALGIRMAAGLADGAVDAMVTPMGLGALMEGRKVWNRASGLPPPTRADTGDRAQPLQDPRYRFESPSRFTATVTGADGTETTFVLTRKGLSWKLSDIRLPV